MTACCGEYHTVTLSNDGTPYSFGYNGQGQLGLGPKDRVFLPTPIPNLPQISLISCGFRFTVCVDCEGFMWTFGSNNYGQLGTGNTTYFNTPQKILEIPPVVSVSCGFEHTLIITTDSNLWTCGNNFYGQLCLENRETQMKPQKTSFSSISKTSAGHNHSLFQNIKEEIFACGFNQNGQCGLGHKTHPQMTPSLIPNVPLNIAHFICGSEHNLFLDSEGNVFSVGLNRDGELGLGHRKGQRKLRKIPNIPPIQTISCVNASSYLIDFEGNLWSFGNNPRGQLGHGGNFAYLKTPKIISTFKDIQQISYGCCGTILLPKILKIKYLPQEKTISDNLEQETFNYIQLSKK